MIKVFSNIFRRAYVNASIVVFRVVGSVVIKLDFIRDVIARAREVEKDED